MSFHDPEQDRPPAADTPTGGWPPAMAAGPRSRARALPPVAWLIGLVLAAVLGTLLFVAGYLVASGQPVASCAAPSTAFTAFCEAYERLKSDYVDPLDDTELSDGALRGLFEYGVADPHSSYMPPEAFDQARQELSGRFEGIGAEMEVRNLEDADGDCAQLSEVCALVVVTPISDSPAEEAGLLPGDIVRAVDGEEVAGSTMQEQIGRVRGPAGTDVTLRIERDGEEFDLTITRAEIVIREVETRVLESGVGYIALRGFSDKSAEEFRDGLQELLDQDVEQIVFDLRNNPGGYITAAQEIASQFVDSGLIFSQESHGEETQEWHAEPGGLATDPSLDVVVLTNGGSASAAEIVAVALQERGRATVIGEPTFGKDSVQIWAPLQNNGGVRITISRWFGPNHVSVGPRGQDGEIRGLQPDVVVEIPEGTPPERDLILERAVAYLRGETAGEETSLRAAPEGGEEDDATYEVVGYAPEALPAAA